MKITTHPENQPDFRASIRPIPGSNLDEITLEPLTPDAKPCTLQVDTRVFARMSLNHTYSVYPKNHRRGFFQVTRISWGLFVFDWPRSRSEDPTPLLLEKVCVQFSFPKPRIYYRAIDPEVKHLEVGSPFSSIQIFLTSMEEWEGIQRQFSAKTDFSEVPRSFPCTAVLFASRENPEGTIYAAFVYPLASPAPDPKSVADLFTAFRTQLAEVLGLPCPEAALQEEIVAKAAYLVGRCKTFHEILPNPIGQPNSLIDTFHTFRVQIAQILQLPNPEHALPEEILLRAEALVRYLTRQQGMFISS